MLAGLSGLYIFRMQEERVRNVFEADPRLALGIADRDARVGELRPQLAKRWPPANWSGVSVKPKATLSIAPMVTPRSFCASRSQSDQHFAG
jgi:hypothetical protein